MPVIGSMNTGENRTACFFSGEFIHGQCCPIPLPCQTQQQQHSHHTTTTSTSRSDFAATTAAVLFPNTCFTNHESIPSLSQSFSVFLSAYPFYTNTTIADELREKDYRHLLNHSCFDYNGFGLFSQSQSPLFTISYRPAVVGVLKSPYPAITPIETAVRKRIMKFLNLSEEDYGMVCSASRSSAFKMIADSFEFETHRRALTVYDHVSEEVEVLTESARIRKAKVLSASFSWPSLRINSADLKKMLVNKKKNGGMFVFPLQSRVTGARYPYLWMKFAQENGWHVLLDASGLGPKDLDTLGLSLIQPDFIVCSFYNVFGGDPSGFAAVFIKKTSASVLRSSMVTAGAGVVSLVPARSVSRMSSNSSGTTERSVDGFARNGEATATDQQGEDTGDHSAEITELQQESASAAMEIDCEGLNHADKMGLLLISSRLRYITNWLVNALTKLRHPHSDICQPLVKIYGPKIKFDRAPAVAFNVFDWKGENVDPALVQKLADRNNISLNCSYIHNLRFPDKYLDEKNSALGNGARELKKSDGCVVGVVSASLGFLNNFEDAFRLWTFVARFLDADFVEKERWRYTALNQKLVEV